MKQLTILGPLLLCTLCGSAQAGTWEMAYARIEKPSLDMKEPDAVDYNVAQCVDVDVEVRDMECETVD